MTTNTHNPRVAEIRYLLIRQHDLAKRLSDADKALIEACKDATQDEWIEAESLFEAFHAEEAARIATA